MSSCDKGDNLISSSNEIDVNWILLKYNDYSPFHCDFPFNTEYVGEGYVLLSTEDEDLDSYFDDGLFVPNQNPELSYDLSDSFCDDECCDTPYNVSFPNPINRIIYNTDMNYITFFYKINTPNEDLPVTINLQDFELIDYR